MVTVKEIAKACNVSPSTVSNILNAKHNVSEQTRKRVLAYVEKSGYRPNYFAQSIRKLSNRTISIITEDLLAFGTNAIVESAMAYCDDHHFRTILMNLRLYHKWDTWYENVEKLKTILAPAVMEARSIKVDGIIYVAGHCRKIDFFPPDLTLPVVIAYGLSGHDRFPSVVIDDEQGGYDITEHLIHKGHKKIGVIAGVADNLHSKNRLLGYQKALFKNGILFDPSLILNGNWRRSSGYGEAEKLAGQGVTAIFCMNDEMAAGAYDFFHSKGALVGRDISIVGYDNSEISEYIHPRLTTGEICLQEIGKRSAELMLQSLNRRESDHRIIKTVKIPCKVIERSSVATINE